MGEYYAFTFTLVFTIASWNKFRVTHTMCASSQTTKPRKVKKRKHTAASSAVPERQTMNNPVVVTNRGCYDCDVCCYGSSGVVVIPGTGVAATAAPVVVYEQPLFGYGGYG